MNRSAAATGLITTLMLIACGGGDGGAPAADGPPDGAAQGSAAATGGPINSFTFVRVPSRLAGTGTLTIESHTGRGMGGRMSGTVVGALTDGGTGEPVSIEVSFDINLACAG